MSNLFSNLKGILLGSKLLSKTSSTNKDYEFNSAEKNANFKRKVGIEIDVSKPNAKLNEILNIIICSIPKAFYKKVELFEQKGRHFSRVHKQTDRQTNRKSEHIHIILWIVTELYGRKY
jgi:hypothetical protein